ncbi:FAD-binding oxidoreductase [Streptomyces capillispiralis]|nr:FAD-binding oxidoreductase [Streptomyces capillispiralis]
MGVSSRLLDRSAVRALEPALGPAPGPGVHGGVHYVHDQSIDPDLVSRTA